MTPVAEESLSLDIANDDLKPLLARHQGAFMLKNDGRAIHVSFEHDKEKRQLTLNHLPVEYLMPGNPYPPDTILKQSVTMQIALQTTAPNYGGERWWFSCPECHRRARVLYLPPKQKHFKCRKCHNLTYSSCRESGDPFKQWMRRIRRLEQKLNAKPNEFPPPKPKGMHWRTYGRLIRALQNAWQQWNATMGNQLDDVKSLIKQANR